jgi:acyl-CoA thioester hydrolase
MSTRSNPATDGVASGAAGVRIQRRIEWIDTDAAGVSHWSTVCRLADAAEAALHTALGIEDRTFGSMPRVAMRFDFRRPLRFNELADVAISVTSVGSSSVSYSITVTGPNGLAADGEVTAVLIDPASGRPRPWPADLRLSLAEAGAQTVSSTSGRAAQLGAPSGDGSSLRDL